MPEFWASLQQAQDSLCWLRDILDRAGESESRSEITSWDSAVSFVQEEPGTWKRLIRRPTSIALLCELWKAVPTTVSRVVPEGLCQSSAYLPPSRCNEELRERSAEFVTDCLRTRGRGPTMLSRSMCGSDRVVALSQEPTAPFASPSIRATPGCSIQCQG